jgi:hypothetical protein
VDISRAHRRGWITAVLWLRIQTAHLIGMAERGWYIGNAFKIITHTTGRESTDWIFELLR